MFPKQRQECHYVPAAQTSQLGFALCHPIGPLTPPYRDNKSRLAPCWRAPSSGDNTSTPSTEVFHRRASLSIKAIGSIPILRNPDKVLRPKCPAPNNTSRSFDGPAARSNADLSRARCSRLTFGEQLFQCCGKFLVRNPFLSTNHFSPRHRCLWPDWTDFYQQLLPPSTTRFVPVMYDDASEHRNTIAP